MTKFFEGINDDTKYKIMRNEFVEMLRPFVGNDELKVLEIQYNPTPSSKLKVS